MLSLFLFLGVAFSASCDSFDFSSFPQLSSCTIPSAYVNAQAFTVSSASNLVGGTVQVAPGVSSVQLSLWVSNGTFPSFFPTPLYAWNLSVSPSTPLFSFSLPGGAVFPLKPGLTYAFGVVLSTSNNQAVTCLNGTFPLSSEQGSFQLVGSSYCVGVPCTPNNRDIYPALLYLTPTVCNVVVACSSEATCDACTSSGCAWCEDSNSCGQPSPTCRSQITQPKYCPVTPCPSLSSCSVCTSDPSCVWCLNSNGCEYFHNVTCQNRVGDPGNCPH